MASSALKSRLAIERASARLGQQRQQLKEIFDSSAPLLLPRQLLGAGVSELHEVRVSRPKRSKEHRHFEPRIDPDHS